MDVNDAKLQQFVVETRAQTALLLQQGVRCVQGKRRTGGSALAQVYGQIGDLGPDVRLQQVKNAFEVTQGLVKSDVILAGHDISDGGIAVALLEMAFAGVGGFAVNLLPVTNLRASADGSAIPPPDAFALLFAEECGLVLEVPSAKAATVTSLYTHAGVPCTVIGSTSRDADCSISVAGEPVISGSVAELRDVWEATSFELERLQCAKEAVDAEQAGLRFRAPPKWSLSFIPSFSDPRVASASRRPRVAILREEGSNGDREMAAAVYMAGMEPWDVTMSDLAEGRAALADFRGIVFVGGFSYADTLDSAKGWASSIRFSQRVLPQFEAFYARDDTWSLGVCNGCQLMALLGWVPGALEGGAARLPDAQQPRFVHNVSERFECRWVTVAVQESPAVLLRGMVGSVMGVWVAHGEGRCLFPDPAVKAHVLANDLAPIRYADARGLPTEVYPFNPNGSPLGIAALCSPDGRHLAMMPHPERCFLGWQLPWAPKDAGISKRGAGPWLRLFQNAQAWMTAGPLNTSSMG